jgi:hypothetical protein
MGWAVGYQGGSKEFSLRGGEGAMFASASGVDGGRSEA